MDRLSTSTMIFLNGDLMSAPMNSIARADFESFLHPEIIQHEFPNLLTSVSDKNRSEAV